MTYNTEKLSRDGYIINQDLFAEFPYRTTTSDRNGCGWIAAYNLRHALGQDVYFDDVRSELDEMHEEKKPGPTLMRIMRSYLDRYVPGFKETGDREAVEAAAKSLAGIFRYTESGIPHFVAFVKAGNGAHDYRFFNVNDVVLDEVIDMYEFAEGHFLGDPVIALTVGNCSVPGH